MLRVALHALVGSSLLAGPPGTAPGRDYAGEDGVEIESAAADIEPAPVVVETVVPEPPPVEPEPEAPPPPVVPEPEGPVDDTEPEEVPYDPLVDSPEAIRARGWVRSGAVFMAVGGVLAIGSVAMSTAKVNTVEDQNVCNPRNDIAGNGCLEEARRRAVTTLAVPGALLLAGGVAMLVTGKVQQRRLRASLRASRREVMLGVQLTF